MKRTVVLGFYGATLDAGVSPKRWDRWRPSVDLCRHEDLLIDRLELLYSRQHTKGTGLLAQDIAQISPETKVQLQCIELDDPWDFETVFAALHDFARGYRFHPERERYLVHITTGSHVMQICWFLLTESRHLPAQLIQTSPPGKQHRASPGRYQIIDLDLSRYDRLARRFHREREDSLTFLKSGIATKNADFNALIENIERVALRSREPILFTGPTGAGKSHLARQLYELKRSRGLVSGPMVEVNCATIRGDSAMSALFGHVKGAFTGAAKDRKGLLRAADGGLLFLDEIGELGLDEQAMLLGAVEEKRFLPVGTDAPVSSDFQLVAGTNRDLKDAVAKGTFREDLLARIHLWTFALPGLTERREDIEPNLDFELERCSERLGTRVTMNREARARFLTFARAPSSTWTANFRDFGAAVLRMATLAPAGRIDLRTVRDEEQRLTRSWSPAQGSVDDGLEGLLPAEQLASIDPFDRVQLAEVARVCRSSRSLSEAGRRLFSASRAKRASTNDADRLRKYLARFELSWERIHG